MRRPPFIWNSRVDSMIVVKSKPTQNENPHSPFFVGKKIYAYVITDFITAKSRRVWHWHPDQELKILEYFQKLDMIFVRINRRFFIKFLASPGHLRRISSAIDVDSMTLNQSTVAYLTARFKK